MDLKEKAKLLVRTVNGLSGRVVVVEGKRDALALQKCGIFFGAVAAVGKPERVVEKAGATGRVSLLFDFDDEGERKTRVFSELFRCAGAEVDTLSRKRFRQVLGITFFEEMPAKLREFEEKMKMQKICEKVI